jgi:hypothetical protein
MDIMRRLGGGAIVNMSSISALWWSGKRPVESRAMMSRNRA